MSLYGVERFQVPKRQIDSRQTSAHGSLVCGFKNVSTFQQYLGMIIWLTTIIRLGVWERGNHQPDYRGLHKKRGASTVQLSLVRRHPAIPCSLLDVSVAVLGGSGGSLGLWTQSVVDISNANHYKSQLKLLMPTTTIFDGCHSQTATLATIFDEEWQPSKITTATLIELTIINRIILASICWTMNRWTMVKHPWPWFQVNMTSHCQRQSRALSVQMMWFVPPRKTLAISSTD